ncbi:phosphate/phosphite/phosphonate ABC transporter substrate-binding protein [Geminicoccus flavidas]|uniref:phosphate/phosphite/phosphonate ABC transporter substrate-binding protein n=1 Tax=Geminicoccus flavidas TaxID=2506407 RepID=UPI00135C06CB|nr:PhnD/SsuA/transferrin family substrate-binding protein [Geminicoccus flavidas]
MIAALPMYDLPELADATAAWWQGIARHGGFAAALERPADLQAHWRSPNLLFSQTCGYPLTHGLAGQVRYLATPCYAAEGCHGPFYRSAILVREDAALASFTDAEGAKLAINSEDSQSGCNVLRVMAAETSAARPFFGAVVRTGGHLASMAAVQEGQADLAAIDAVTLALAARARPAAVAGLRRLAWSPAAPALPYITRPGLPTAVRQALVRAIQAACADPRLAAVRQELLIDGVAVLNPEAYQVIPGMHRRAHALGMTELG